MRWSGQEITVEQADTLPGLAKLNNLVRSVQTPEFAGITFHEVLAKTALNHVPGASNALPFGWTINPYRGCSHACAYCMSPDTLILMADGRQKALRDVVVGDAIMGTETRGNYRRYVETTVRAKWASRKQAFRVTLADGTELTASADHRFLTERGWKHVRGAMVGVEQRPYLTLNNKLLGFGLSGLNELDAPSLSDPDYQRGYLTGMVRGDGLLFHKEYVRANGNLSAVHRFRLALADGEALVRSQAYLAAAGVETQRRPFAPASETRRSITAIHTAKRHQVEAIEKIVDWPLEPSRAWHAGFLAGIFDAEGSCSDGVLRISNKALAMIGQTRQSLGQLGITFATEPPRENGVTNIRVTGGLPMRSRFFRMTNPAITRKLDIRGRAVKSDADLRIVSIEDLGVEIDMIDITTGTEDFIANGVIAHNCFARPTHEYLDLDAGKDFDSQIIVKVNVAEVVAREVARPSWRHHTVALGTNTDPYQRAEGRYRLMPGIIAALAASGTPLSILTKGTLLRRDLPLLQAAAERVPVDLAMSIAVFDHELQQSVEPGTPSTEARLATIRAATDAGFRCTVLVMPVLPYLTDSIAHLDRAFGMIAESGAVSTVYSALHLRPGVKEWFFLWLEREHPELVGRYRELYRSGAYAPKEYRRWLAGRVKPILRRHGLDRTRLDPTTGTVRGNASGRTNNALLAAELAPTVAASLQPTLF